MSSLSKATLIEITTFLLLACIRVAVDTVLTIVYTYTCSSVPEKAHYLCADFPSAVALVEQSPLADMVETIWILGGPSVYRVRVREAMLTQCLIFLNTHRK